MRVIKAINSWEREGNELVVFLAGSIEMGKAEQWQEKIEKELYNLKGILLNPRRDDWDSSWEQSINNKQFREQVNWELDGLDKADIIAMYFDPQTKSPITLLELGLLKSKSVCGIVCCPDGFWRKGNVDIVCFRYRIKMSSKEDFVNSIVREIERKRVYCD